mgnify:CR=1 FL=1
MQIKITYINSTTRRDNQITLPQTLNEGSLISTAVQLRKFYAQLKVHTTDVSN